jgi:hypothetical protein
MTAFSQHPRGRGKETHIRWAQDRPLLLLFSFLFWEFLKENWAFHEKKATLLMAEKKSLVDNSTWTH